MNTNTDAYYLFQFLQQITGIDIEKKLEESPGYRKGTLGTFIMENDLFEVYKELSAGYIEDAYIKGYELLKELLCKITIQCNVECLQEVSNIVSNAIQYVQRYNEWKKLDDFNWKQEIFSIPLLNADEKTDENASKISRLAKTKCRNTVLTTKFFNIYSYASGTQLEHKSYEYEISDTFLITSDIHNILSTIKPTSDDKLHYYLICKIEERIEFSYFLIVTQYKDSVFIATDALVFDNPRMKDTTRSASRRRENHWDNVYLPYGVIDDIMNWRKESNALMDTKHKVEERYIKKISEYLGFGDKCCLWFLMEALTEKLINEYAQLKQIGFVDEQLPKLLEGPVKSKTFDDINTQRCQEYVDEFIFPKETSLAVVDKEQLLQKYVEPNWLVTTESLTNLVEWTSKEDIRRQKQEVLTSYYNGYTNGTMNIRLDKDKLKAMMMQNIERLESIIFSADSVYIHVLGERNCSFCFGNNKENILTKITNVSDIFGNIFPNISLYNRSYTRPRCFHCDNHNASVQFNFAFHHYAELMFMLGIHSREELPRVYQNYKTFQFIPYVGNSILDNVNPEFLLKDPLSSSYPNYYFNSILLDKFCYKKLLKKYKKYNDVVYVISKTGELIETLDKKTFNEKYKEQ